MQTQQLTREQISPIKPTWQNVADGLPEEGLRVMLVNSRHPSGYPKFAVIRYHHGAPYWKLMPERSNVRMSPDEDDSEYYDLWAYTNQPTNPHDPQFAQPRNRQGK